MPGLVHHRHLGAAVAHSSGLDGVSFYENGIVSINLPLCGQEVGGRATRTTHPQSLHGFEKIFWRDMGPMSVLPQVGLLVACAFAFFIIARQLARKWEVV